MTAPTLLQAVQSARDETKRILNALEQTGHPQTGESSSLYLALVTVQKRLAARDAGPGANVAAELEQLATLCAGKLEAVKPLLEEALRIARRR